MNPGRRLCARRPPILDGVAVGVTMARQIAAGHRIEGWAVSLVLHGLLLSALLPLFRSLPITIAPQPFRWDVTLVQGTQPVDDSMPAPVAEDRNPIASTETSPPLASAASRFEDGVAFTELVGTDSARPTVPTVTEPPPTNLIPSDAPTDISLARQESTASPRPLVDKPAPQNPAPQETDVGLARSIEPPIHQADSPTAAEPISPAPTAVVANGMPAAPEQHPVPAAPVTAAASAEPRPDYGWLQRAVLERLEELKRSSRPFLADSTRLKVLVKAVVSNEGELMEVSVAKSSGFERIDQEAISLVQRAFPMHFDRSLDRPQIVMRIPITYARN